MKHKLTDVVIKLEKAGNNPVVKWLGRLHDIGLVLGLGLICTTAVVYAYEYFTPIESYIDPLAVIPTKAEYDGGDPIDMMMLVNYSRDIGVIETSNVLRCDIGDGDGFEFISASDAIIPTQQISPAGVTVIDKFIDQQQVSSNKDIARWLRETAIDIKIQPNRYNGAVPNDSSTCFTEHTITVKTEILGLTKSVRINGYSFDYIWYNND